MRFYVKNDTAQDGPFDLLMMVRKIRNGTVTATALVLEERDAEAVPAAEHPELIGFFREIELEGLRVESPQSAPALGFSSAFKRGVRFLIAHQFSAVYGVAPLGCALLLFMILSAILPDFASPLSALLAWIFLQFALGILLFVFLRMHRGQTLDITSLTPFIRHNLTPLIFCAALVGVFSAIGGLLFVVPGMLSLVLTVPGVIVLAFYSFAPLLIIEKNYHFWEAMESSRKTVLAQGRPLFEVVFGFALINVLAGCLYGLPLALALPVTFGALAEIFDEIEFV
jgi:GYF domain 2